MPPPVQYTVKLDDRAGSKELYAPLTQVGLRVELGRMEYGDIAFDGLGRDDVPIVVGIEYKKVSDVIQCIQDGRFAGHQLPGLLESYNQSWLLVEGQVRCGPGGVLQELHWSGKYHDCGFGNRQFRYQDWVAWLTTMEIRGGIRVITARTQGESAATVAGLVSWYGRGFESHRSHLAFDLTNDTMDTIATLVRPNLVRRVAKELPGVGWQKSKDIANKFTNVIEMVAADESEWVGIPGIGKGIAKKIRRELGWGDGE